MAERRSERAQYAGSGAPQYTDAVILGSGYAL